MKSNILCLGNFLERGTYHTMEDNFLSPKDTKGTLIAKVDEELHVSSPSQNRVVEVFLWAHG